MTRIGGMDRVPRQPLMATHPGGKTPVQRPKPSKPRPGGTGNPDGTVGSGPGGGSGPRKQRGAPWPR